ncbi:MAG TPA: DinB family protein [Planctomycetota bacterium]|nr:DinB family protein [Planctomycetota bacterium]
MTPYAQTILQLLDYEVHCNLQSLDFLARLADEELHRDMGFGWRTLHRTVFHIANVLRTWSRCVGPVIEKPEPLAYRAEMPLAEIRAMIVELGDAWRLAAKASHEQGLLDSDRRLHQVFHLVTHGTHHRGQLLSMLTLLGYPQPFEGGDFGGWSKGRHGDNETQEHGTDFI